jgi:hypothetical protein
MEQRVETASLSTGSTAFASLVAPSTQPQTSLLVAVLASVIHSDEPLLSLIRQKGVPTKTFFSRKIIFRFHAFFSTALQVLSATLTRPPAAVHIDRPLRFSRQVHASSSRAT